MSRKSFSIICLILCLYVGYTQYLIYGYCQMNDKLGNIVMTLIAACQNNHLNPDDKKQYK